MANLVTAEQIVIDSVGSVSLPTPVHVLSGRLITTGSPTEVKLTGSNGTILHVINAGANEMILLPIPPPPSPPLRLSGPITVSVAQKGILYINYRPGM